jgi:aspartate/tyrosine/aromatic aminotransferase
LTEFFARSTHIPLIDFAYQGFKHGLEEDAAPVRRLVTHGIPALIAVSLSKSFSLYSQRVGALHVVTRSAAEQRATLSHLKQIVRCIYSNPPSRGAQLVSEVLSDPSLESTWRTELAAMRTRIAAMRQAFAQGMQSRGFDFSHVCDQYGMFSFTGISASAVRALKDRHGIFMTDNGRISVPALNPANVDYLCDSFAEVLRSAVS